MKAVNKILNIDRIAIHSLCQQPNFACIFDIDGVITKGPNFITVSKPAIEALIQLKVPIVFLSNTCVLESDKAKQLTSMLGITVRVFYNTKTCFNVGFDNID